MCNSKDSDQSTHLSILAKVIRMKKYWALTIHRAPSEDSDQTVRMRMLIWVFAGRTCQKVHFHVAAQIFYGICDKKALHLRSHLLLASYIYQVKSSQTTKLLFSLKWTWWMKTCQSLKLHYKNPEDFTVNTGNWLPVYVP